MSGDSVFSIVVLAWLWRPKIGSTSVFVPIFPTRVRMLAAENLGGLHILNVAWMKQKNDPGLKLRQVSTSGR